MTLLEKITPISAFNDNYIWYFFDNKTKKAWVVDPGDANPVITTLQNLELDLAGIIITHHHHDHSGGALKLLSRFKEISIYSSHKSPHFFITHPVQEGDEIILSSLKLTVMEIPGHTLDHIAFFNEDILFCGDTLFSAGCGKIFEGTPAQMYQSLNKLSKLTDSTKMYCGHEYTLANLRFAHEVDPRNIHILKKIEKVTAERKQNLPSLPSLLGEEKNINPFLRCDKPEIKESVEKYTKKKLKNPLEVFTHLREWKNAL